MIKSTPLGQNCQPVMWGTCLGSETDFARIFSIGIRITSTIISRQMRITTGPAFNLLFMPFASLPCSFAGQSLRNKVSCQYQYSSNNSLKKTGSRCEGILCIYKPYPVHVCINNVNAAEHCVI